MAISRSLSGLTVLVTMVLFGAFLAPANATSDNVATILTADPTAPAGRPGAGFRITYRWQVTPMDTDYTVFVHVVDQAGTIVLQDDHEPPAPTSTWKGLVTYTRTVPLERWQVKDKRTVNIALAAGQYAICAGLYDKEGGRKALLRTGPGVTQADEGRYRIGTLTVDAQAPMPGPGARTLDLTGYHVTYNEEFDDLSVSAWGPAGPGGEEIFLLSPDSGAKPGQRVH